MTITGLDHIVLCVADTRRTIHFYASLLAIDAREERQGKWSLHFGTQKISLQDVRSAPAMAQTTLAGSGNFCLVTDEPIDELARRLLAQGIEILDGPGERDGAIGRLSSIYFRDPDGNLVEVSNHL